MASSSFVNELMGMHTRMSEEGNANTNKTREEMLRTLETTGALRRAKAFFQAVLLKKVHDDHMLPYEGIQDRTDSMNDDYASLFGLVLDVLDKYQFRASAMLLREELGTTFDKPMWKRARTDLENTLRKTEDDMNITVPSTPHHNPSLVERMLKIVRTGASCEWYKDTFTLENQDLGKKESARAFTAEISQTEDHSDEILKLGTVIPLLKPKWKSIDETYVVSNHSQKVIVRREGDVAGQAMNIDLLTNCRILLVDYFDSLNIDECVECEFVIGPTAGSIFFRDCKNLTITAACKQLRLRDCHNIQLHLFAQTDPVIESSSAIVFQAFDMQLPNLDELFNSSGLDPSMNRFIHVYDFTPSEDSSKPHFQLKTPDICGAMPIRECRGLEAGDKHSIQLPKPLLDYLEGRTRCAPSCEERNPSKKF